METSPARFNYDSRGLIEKVALESSPPAYSSRLGSAITFATRGLVVICMKYWIHKGSRFLVVTVFLLSFFLLSFFLPYQIVLTFDTRKIGQNSCPGCWWWELDV